MRVSRRIVALVTVLTAGVLAPACTPTAESPNPVGQPDDGLLPLRAVRGAPGRIVDSAGRDVQLRGVNVNSLGDYFEVDPRLPATQPLTPELWTDLAERGYNVVRLVTTWSAWEPQRDQLDETYVQQVADAIQAANDAGIYVVIDMHQDAWSKEVYTPRDVTCPPGTKPQIGWDGAPAWATITNGASTCGQGGGPGGREENPAVKAAWASFYTNADGIRDELAELWGQIAERFGTIDGVAGYDLLNEPGFSEDAGQTNDGLVAFYRSAITEIRAGEARAAAPPRMVFFEGVLGTVPVQPVNFSDDPDLVFAPHNYAESIGASVPGLLELLANATIFLGGLYRTPVWVGEYGAFGGDEVGWFSRFGKAYDTAGSAGGAWWQWTSECGDPHALSDIWPPTEEQIVERAAECGGNGDHPVYLHWEKPCAVRSYPLAAPRLDAVTAAECGGSVRVRGGSTQSGVAVPSRVDLWYQPPAGSDPGDPGVAPVVTGAGAGAVTSTPTGIGWRVSVAVSGPYDLTVAPAGTP